MNIYIYIYMKIIYSIKFIIIICWVFFNKNINCCKTGCSCKKKGNKNPNNEIRIIRPQKHIKNNKSLVPGNKKPKSNEIKKNTTEKTDEIKKNTTEKTNINNNYNGQSKNLNDETHKNKNNKNIKKKDTNTISIKDEIIKNKNIKTNKANNDIQNKNNLINKSNNFDKNNNEINNINENYDKTSSYKKDEPNKINNETNNNLNNLQSNINININENKIDTNKSKIDINKSNSNDINKNNTTKNNEKIVTSENKNNISTTNLNISKNKNNSNKNNDDINPELNISKNKNNSNKNNDDINPELNIPENKNNSELNILNNNNTNLNNPKNNNDSDNKLNIPQNDVINPKLNIQNNNNTTESNIKKNNNNNNTTESNIQNNKNNSDKNNDNINPIKIKNNNINIPPKINSNLYNKTKLVLNYNENNNKSNDTTNNNLAKKNNKLNNNDILKNLPVNNENTINNDSNNNSNLNNNIKYNNDLDKKPNINNTTKIENINKDKEQLEQLEQLEHQYKGKNKKPDINYNNIHNPGFGINNIFINSEINNNKNLNNGNNNKNNIKANNITNNNNYNQEKHKKTNINNNKQKNKIDVDPEYKEMYIQMSQYFKDDFIFELINERKNLKDIGICNALDNIITKNLVFIPYFKKNKNKKNTPTHTHVNLDKKKKIKNGIKSTNIHTDLATIYDKKGFDDLKDEFIFPSGAIFIENEYFKYLRCKGKCNSKKCVSCKLRKYLDKKGLAELFILIYLNQGNSSRSEYSNYIKKIINEGLKEEIKQSINYYWNKEVNTEDLDDEGENIKKCFFIEWALTIEFLTRFSKILSADGNLTLYRVVTIDKNEIKKISPYESTSIFGQPFIPQYSIGKEKCFIVEKAEIWRCIFSYIISPDDKSMFYSSITNPTERKYLNSLDYELEIGYIPIGKEKDYKYNGSIDNAHNELEKKCKEFYNQNINKIYDKTTGNLLLKFQNGNTTLIEGNYEEYKQEEDDDE